MSDKVKCRWKGGFRYQAANTETRTKLFDITFDRDALIASADEETLGLLRGISYDLGLTCAKMQIHINSAPPTGKDVTNEVP